MKEVNIFRSERESVGDLNVVVDEFTRIAASQARVYKTFIPLRNLTFITTSKDVHLKLGQMTVDGQMAFARFLLSKFEEELDETLLVHHGNRSIMAVRAIGSDGLVVTLQPAN